VNFNKEKRPNDFQKNYNRRLDCNINRASNEIMLHRISEGKDIEFPFSSFIRE